MRSGSEEPVKVTRSIMIMKPPQSANQGDQTGTPPASPAGSTPPISPLSGKLLVVVSFVYCKSCLHDLTLSE